MRMLRMIGSIRTMKNIITKGRIKDRKYIRNLGAVRNIRRDANDAFKKQNKANEISDDELNAEYSSHYLYSIGQESS